MNLWGSQTKEVTFRHFVGGKYNIMQQLQGLGGFREAIYLEGEGLQSSR